METLLLSFLSHGISDFILQSEAIVKQKTYRMMRGFIIHGVVTFIVLVLLLYGYQMKTVLIYALIVTGLHLAIDLIKVLLTPKNNQKFDLFWFMLDQIIHLLLILGIWQFFDFHASKMASSLYTALLWPKTLTVIAQSLKAPSPWPTIEILIVLIGYIYVCFGGTFLVRKIMDVIQSSAIFHSSHSKVQSGIYIGILERFLILVLVQNSSISSVAFILTAKSIARFNELNNKEFAEYYLIGTLTSTALAIGGGYLLNYLLFIIK